MEDTTSEIDPARRRRAHHEIDQQLRVRASDLGAVTLDRVRDRACDQWEKRTQLGKLVNVARCVERAIKDETRKNKKTGTRRHQRELPCDDQGETPASCAPGSQEDAVIGIIDRKKGSAERLKAATFGECRKWYRKAYGREFDEDLKRRIKDEVSLAQQNSHVELASVEALKKLAAAIRSVDQAVAPLRGLKMAQPLRKGDPPTFLRTGDFNALGGTVTRWVQEIDHVINCYPLIHGLRRLADNDIDGLRVGIEGHRGAPVWDAEHRLVWLVLDRSGQEPITAGEFAKLWILLGNFPRKLPERAKTPNGVIKHVADSIKKIVPIVTAARKRDAQTRALIRRLRAHGVG